tara:strand:+ start:955 stop:2103 length:1149 start_codon:yes stop_codon:yes gene_type:complete
MSAGTFFKTFSSSDRTTTRTLLHEAIPITGTLVSGTYATTADAKSLHGQRNVNIKTYSHGMFQSVYDYPHLSSSANHIFDISVGYSTGSGAGASGSVSGNVGTKADDPQAAKKVNIYNQMAQQLVGYDTSGRIRAFDEDGNLGAGNKIHNAIFLNFSRLLVKDEIKKGSFKLNLGYGAYATPNKTGDIMYISDAGAATSYHVNSPAGEYGILKSGSTNVGLIYYQAGICVLTSSVIREPSNGAGIVSTPAGALLTARGGPLVNEGAAQNFQGILTGSTIDMFADAFRRRIENISFNNTTELNSTVYFCRANHNEFNYSSNPTFLTGSKIRVKGEDPIAPPRTYVTTVGLYSADNELLAVAKLSEPLRKDPTNELTLRVRLDY